MTGKFITDSIYEILTKFGATQDQRYDKDFISWKRDQVRAQLIIAEFKQRGSTNPAWYQDLNLITMSPVLKSDLNYGLCPDCPVSKAFFPTHIPLFNPDAQNEDDGLVIMSPCGTKKFYATTLEILNEIPSEHPFSKFKWYWEIGNEIFVNQKLEQLRSRIVCQTPSDVNVINNVIVPSGKLVVGTTYKVINYQIVHNTFGYNAGTTFVAANTTYTGQGAVILNSPIQVYDEAISNYPVTSDMARMIELEILTKEFGLEKQQISAFKNEFGETNTQVVNRAAQV